MSTLIGDCPRCQSQKVTFEIAVANWYQQEYGWVDWYEVPAKCRHCNRMTIFKCALSDISAQEAFKKKSIWSTDAHINSFFNVIGFVSIKDNAVIIPPEHVPDDIADIFREGSACLSLSCYNAAGSMFRLALDMTTKSLLPPEGEEGGPNRAQRTRLFDRLNWLFDSHTLPLALREIADCVREDGNDAAHDGTLAKADAEDLVDFLRVVLERVYTEPQRVEEAKARRLERRSS
jgi:hypothetical protein